jgi:hypothetical protein
MSRWEVTGIPEGESGDFSIHHCTTTTGPAGWLNYVNYKSLTGGPYTVLCQKFNGSPWLNIMQDSEAEYTEHDWLVSRMSGDILLGGLGIGMIHIPLLASSAVTSVTIVEKYQDVIDLVWDDCPKDERFTIVCDDINTWDPDSTDGLPTTNWDVAWFDTWLTHDEPLSQYITRMNDKYGSYVSEIGGWDWPTE